MEYLSKQLSCDQKLPAIKVAFNSKMNIELEGKGLNAMVTFMYSKCQEKENSSDSTLLAQIAEQLECAKDYASVEKAFFALTDESVVEGSTRSQQIQAIHAAIFSCE